MGALEQLQLSSWDASVSFEGSKVYERYVKVYKQR